MTNEELLAWIFDIGPIVALAAAALWMIRRRLR
jgi:hypothetical protein